MKLSHSVFVALLLACFAIHSSAAGPYPVKNKKKTAAFSVKNTSEQLLPDVVPAVSNLYIVLFNADTGKFVDGPHVLTAKVKRKTDEVKMWYFKEKKNAIFKYKPAKRKVSYKAWKNLPDTVLIAALAKNMACVPSGTFVMGNCVDASEGAADEIPVHTVTIDSFFMDTYEVSNGKMREALQWAFDNGKIFADITTVKNIHGIQQELLDLDGPECQISFSNGLFSITSGKTNYPCVEVSWYGACAYCNFRSEREGKNPCYDISNWSCDWNANGYRLPTEAEWEKAVRGGYESNRFAWVRSQTISHALANYKSYGSLSYDASANAGFHPDYNTGIPPYTNPGGAFGGNAYGLHDMPGNVWEWCWDYYSPTYYNNSPLLNPTGPATGTSRVLRGGSWKEYAGYCRAADRGEHDPAASYHHFGFRCTKR
jgi:formylglycine-generating enzyme required for sulfatase activity